MRRLGLAAVVAATVTVAAVAGAFGGGSADAAPVKAAAAKLDGSTSRFTVTTRYEGASPLPDWAVGESQLLRGEMDYRTHRGTLRYGEDKVVFEAVFDGGTIYTREPALTKLLEIQKEWIKSGSDEWPGVNPDDPSRENPATLLGIEFKKGVLRMGADADVVLLDENLQIRNVWARGVPLNG